MIPRITVVIIYVFLLNSCSPVPSQPISIQTIDTNSSPYPSPSFESTSSEGIQHNPSDLIYPPPDEIESNVVGQQIQIKKPLIIGNRIIKGSGPPGVPILIIDVTTDNFLFQTVIDSQGQFEVSVEPLELGHRIGLMIGNLEGTEWENENFNQKHFFGDEALQVPLKGFFHDTAITRADSDS